MLCVKLPQYTLKEAFTMTAKDRYFLASVFCATVKVHRHVELLLS